MRIIQILLMCTVTLIFQIIAIPNVDLFLVGIILITFFYQNSDSVAFALFAGILRDLYFPIFGFHLVLYPVLSLVGIVLIQTLITHKSLSGFIGFSTFCIVVAQMLKIIFAIGLSLMMHGSAGYALVGIRDSFFGCTNSIFVFLFSLVGYMIIDRMSSGKGYDISTNRV